MRRAMDKIAQPGAKQSFAQIMPSHERLPYAGMFTQTIFNQNQGDVPHILQRAGNGGANELILNMTTGKTRNLDCFGQLQSTCYMQLRKSLAAVHIFQAPVWMTP